MTSFRPPFPPQPEGPARTLLVVDDDRATLSLYRAGLKGLQGFRILTAENGSQALEILRHEPVSVLVTDLDMPVLDGFNLIAKTSSLYPQMPVIVMTGLEESRHRNAPLQLGAVRILTKPPRLSLLMDAIREAAQFEPAGVIRGMGLNSILQLLQWERKSCTLTVKSEAGVGRLYLRQGEVIHATFLDEEGLPAAYRILAWPRPDIEFVDTCRVEPTIDLPLTELLLSAAVLNDQAGTGAEGLQG
ncbi:response regulator [Geothrix sp. 21YS21S-4]|uniref:response regulator n=1 Tax=Geothrix sp. 21YS21S-4 TaxID=3068889 RepID=UPI0027BA6C25|nr:response regulator [Geothrix sp. 21YS21S-4]